MIVRTVRGTPTRRRGRLVVLKRIFLHIYVEVRGMRPRDIGLRLQELCYKKSCYPIFATASHHTGLDTRSMIRRSMIVGIKGEGGLARAETQALLDYNAAHQAEGGPADTGGFTASSLPSLDCARTSGRARRSLHTVEPRRLKVRL